MINLSGGSNLSLADLNEAVEQITAEISQEAEVFTGLYLNPEMEDKVRITVIATGFQKKAVQQAGKVPVIGVVKPGEVITEDEFSKMRGKTAAGYYLPHRNNYEENLEIPTLIRDSHFAAAASPGT